MTTTLVRAIKAVRWLPIAGTCLLNGGCSCETTPPPHPQSQTTPQDLTSTENEGVTTPESLTADEAASPPSASGEQAEESADNTPTAEDGGTTSASGPSASTAASTADASDSDTTSRDQRTTPRDDRSSAAPRQRAEQLRQESHQTAKRGDFGSAFEQAHAAWESLEGYRDDPALQNLVQQLLDDMRTFGEAANRAAGGNAESLDGKKLTIQ